VTTRIVVAGANGMMGQSLAALAVEESELEVVGGIVREAGAGRGVVGYARVATPEGAGPLLEAADLVLDFSAPGLLTRLLDAQSGALEGRALVVGTTGLDTSLFQRLEALAKKSAVLVAANFSMGVNLLLALVEEAARLLPAERYDVEIVEAHHRHKVDAPSGTALALGEAVARGRGARLEELRRDGRSGRSGGRPAGEIGFHSLRGGTVPGDHRVLFLGGRERIELAHSAADRSLFAEGALQAARWIAGRGPGWYTMRDVLGGEALRRLND
jgi:4-hydroxy-tetrahydrodipicolinate reductase